jgi:hypothetical protein
MPPQEPAKRVAVVLTPQQVAAWLQVAPRQLVALGVPSLKLSRKVRRYLEGDVQAWLDEQRGRRA